MAISSDQSRCCNLAEAVRQACIHAELESYKDAVMRSLYPKGALEAAISAIRMLDL
jgi:hypothetical protein